MFNLYDFSMLNSQDTIHVSYKGPFTPQILSEIGGFINDQLDHDERTTRKLFKLFMEMALNTSFYSDERNTIGNDIDEQRVGAVVLSESADNFEISTGNIVRQSEIEELKTRCEYINELNREELRKYKIQQRQAPSDSFGGGNIGLITIALTSRNALVPVVKKLDDSFSFFRLTVTLNKITGYD